MARYAPYKSLAPGAPGNAVVPRTLLGILVLSLRLRLASVTHAAFHQRGLSANWHKNTALLKLQACWTDAYRNRITFLVVTPWEVDFLLEFQAKQRRGLGF